MDKFVHHLIKERKIIIFILVILIGMGMYSYYIIPKEENPKTALPVAMVTTIYPGASPTDIESLVTAKIEESISNLNDIEYISSISMNSASVIIVSFDVKVDWDMMKMELRDTVASVQSQLPAMCFESEVETNLVESTQFIISLSGSNYSMEDLATYGEEIKHQLETVDGIQRIDVEGLLDKQVNVITDIAKLDLYNISIENVLNLLMAQNINIPSGSIQYESGEINVNTPSTFSSLKDIENIVVSGSQETIGFVKLRDIANIGIDYADGYSYQQDGQNAILLTGYFKEGLNAVLVGEQVREKLEQLKSQVPEDIVFHEVMYSPEDVDRSISSFIVSLIQSILLIIVVVMIGVKFRNGLIVSFALPLSIFATFIIMYLLKIEFQFISIAALIISLGILVDNAIVMSEAIQVRIDAGLTRHDAIRDAIKETAIPVLTSTITTVITFGILYFIPGAIGSTVATIPTVVITALIASYFVAMIVIPVLASIFFRPASAGKKRMMKQSKTNHYAIKDLFIKLLKVGLRHKIMTMVVAVSTLVIAVFLVLQLGMSFFPFSDKPVIYLNIKGESMSLDSTEQLADQVHEILDAHPAVRNYTTSIGKGLPRFFLTVPSYAPADNFAQIMLQLDLDADRRYSNNQAVGGSIQSQLNATITGGVVEVKYLEYSIPMEARLVLNITGSDLIELQQASALIQTELADIPGTKNIRDNYVPPNYEYVVNLDAELLSTMGIIKYDVVKQINTALMGATTTQYISGGSEMDIVLSADIQTLDDLYRMPINSSVANSQVFLEQVADITMDTSIPTIRRYNKERTITVLCDLKPGYTSFIVENELRSRLASRGLSDDIGIEYLGEVKNMMDLLGNLGSTVAIALLLIYLVLLIQFRDFKKPFIVLSSIPLSLIGCFLGLYLFKMDLQAMALLGIVSLFGIVVNNGIILLECMDNELKTGSSVYEACINAVSTRYRPIVLSATTTCIGLVPLILSGDPMSSPMALVLLFGLLFSTILTMVGVPVMYAITMRKYEKE